MNMHNAYLKNCLFLGMLCILGGSICPPPLNAMEYRDIKSYTTQNININKSKPSEVAPSAGVPHIVVKNQSEDAVLENESQDIVESINEDILTINPDHDQEEQIEDLSNAMSEISVDAGAEKSLQDNAYRLGADDKIKVTVFGEQDLSGEFVVNSDGQITLPLIGSVEVKDQTTTEVERLITSRLKGDYLKDPNVSIEVIQNRPFYILGEVRQPGSYDFVNGMSILKAVAIGGGFTYRANRKSIDVMRGSDGPSEPEAMPPHSSVQPGDVIYVRERFF